MTAYLYQAPVGVPGDVTRPDDTNVEPIMLEAVSAVYAQAFGIPLVYGSSSGKAHQWTGASVAADFQGILTREVPSISGNTLQGFTDNIPNPVQVQGIAVRGYVAVKCVAGTPVRGGIVYIQTTASGGVAVGDFRSDGTDSGNAVALSTTQAEWSVNGKDSDNNAEIRIAR